MNGGRCRRSAGPLSPARGGQRSSHQLTDLGPRERVKPAPRTGDKLRTGSRKGPLHSPAFSPGLRRARPVPPSGRATGGVTLRLAHRASPGEVPIPEHSGNGTRPSSPFPQPPTRGTLQVRAPGSARACAPLSAPPAPDRREGSGRERPYPAFAGGGGCAGREPRALTQVTPDPTRAVWPSPAAPPPPCRSASRTGPAGARGRQREAISPRAGPARAPRGSSGATPAGAGKKRRLQPGARGGPRTSPVSTPSRHRALLPGKEREARWARRACSATCWGFGEGPGASGSPGLLSTRPSSALSRWLSHSSHRVY